MEVDLVAINIVQHVRVPVFLTTVDFHKTMIFIPTHTIANRILCTEIIRQIVIEKAKTEPLKYQTLLKAES